MWRKLVHFLFDFGAALLGVLFGFVGQLAVGQFELHQPPLHLVDLRRHAFQFHRQPAGGLVHQVDGLVGQEAVGDVAVREVGRGDQGRVLDLHALVMGLVARLQAAEDGDRVFDRRLADVDRLEAALQGGVFFDVLAILVERRGADAAQLAAGQGRLEQVGGVAAPFGPAGADDRVQLVDEEDHVAGAASTSRSTALSRSSNSPRNFVPATSAPMSRAIDALVLQALRHVAVARSAGPALRRWPSCRRPARRSARDCSSCAARGPESRGGFPGRGRSPDRACLGVARSTRSMP